MMKRSLSGTFLRSLIPMLVAAFAAAGGVLALVRYQAMSRDLEQKADRTALLLGAALRRPVWNLETGQIVNILKAVKEDPEIAAVSLRFSGKGAALGLVQEGEAQAGSGIVRDFWITDPERAEFVIGEAQLKLTRAIMLVRIRNDLLSLSGIMLLTLAAVVFLNERIQRKVVGGPIRSLVQGIERNASGQAFSPVDVRSEDEIGYLAQTFNGIMGTLKEDARNLEEMNRERGRILAELAALNGDLELRVGRRTAELAEANEKISKAMGALWGEMALAKKIQTMLLPKRPSLKGFEVAVSLEPMEEVGGDYYDVISVDGMDWVILGDVSGHGVTAGLVMMMVQTSIHTLLRSFPRIGPEELLVAVNRAIHHNIRRMHELKHMTIMVMARTGDGTFILSGLHEDILVRRASGSVEAIPTSGIWIGLEEEIRDRTPEGILSLDVGDCAVLYTDGVIEARAPDGRFFGAEGLLGTLGEIPEVSAREVHDQLRRRLDGYAKRDDSTLLVMARRA